MGYKTSEKMAARKETRRRLFLETAVRLFSRHGYHAATVPMIVAGAGSSTGAFYMYFRNKEDVYAAALEDMGARLAAALNEAMAPQPAPDQQMGAAVEAFVEWLARNPAEAGMLMEAAVLGGRIQETQRAIIESHVRSVSAAIARAAPLISSEDRGTLARCWVGAALEAAMGWLRDPEQERLDAKRMARIVKNFTLRGAGISG
jgi:TetR/AcrR family transcriptional regulator, fatty acid metabolism regulator protein